jgi:hypothetical protein
MRRKDALSGGQPLELPEQQVDGKHMAVLAT